MASSRVHSFFRERMVRNYDDCMRPFERRVFGEARARLVPLAEGRVLDVGAGTGTNFPLYTAARLVAAVDPEIGMLAQAAPRARRALVPVALVAASAEALPFPDASFDSVVATLVFCTIPDPVRALREAARVLAPNGRLIMLEHVRSTSRALAAIQDAATPLQKVVAAGCHLNRATQALVARAGFRVDAVRERFRGMVVEILATRPA